MAAVFSTWLVGSIDDLVAQVYQIDGNPYGTDAGPFYLAHTTSAISLLTQLVIDMITEIGAGNSPGFEILQNRRVRLFADVVFTIDWTTTLFRDLIGFTGNLAGASTYTGAAIPRLLFSPGFPALFATDDGISHYDADDTHVEISADGTIVDVNFHNTQEWQEIKWTDVIRGRVQQPDGAAGSTKFGTFHDFRGLVLRPGFRFQVYDTVTEDSSSSSPVVLPGALGTYQLREPIADRYQRVARTAGSRWDLPELRMIEVPEYT